MGCSFADPFDLARFVAAQAGIYDQVLAELGEGRKRNHWMWFIFPQVAGLGHSAMAERYAIAGLEEARAYLLHPVLGPRLSACGTLIGRWAGRRSADAILGETDAPKLQSSMTLFEAAAAKGSPPKALFGRVLETLYDGRRDQATLERV